MYSTPARLAAKPSVSVDGAVKPASQAIDSQPSHRSSAELGRQPQRTVRVGRQPRPRGNTARIINIYEWCARKNSKDGQQWNSYAAQHNRALAEAQNHGHEEVTLSIQGRVYTINLKTLKQTNRQTGSQHDIRPVDIQLHSQQQKCTRLQQPPKTPRQCHVKPLGPNEEHTRNELVSSRPVRRLPPALPAAGSQDHVAATDAATSSAARGRSRSRQEGSRRRHRRGHRKEEPTHGVGKHNNEEQTWRSYEAEHTRTLAEAPNHCQVDTSNLMTRKQTNRQTGHQQDIRPVDTQRHSKTHSQQPPKTQRQCHVKPLGPEAEHTRNELVSSRPVRRPLPLAAEPPGLQAQPTRCQPARGSKSPPALPAAGRKDHVAATDAGTSSAAGGRCRSRSGHREESPTVSSAETVPRRSSEPTVSPASPARRESESPPALRAAGSQDHVAATDAATSSAAGGRSRSRSGHREESPTPSCAETVSSPQRETMSPITPHRKDHASITADAEALILKCEKLISENYSSGLLTSQLTR